jgi:peptide/nickel transport system permease protein
VTVFAITLLAFISIQFIPGDAVTVALGVYRTDEAEAALRHELGLDRSPVEQYLRWLGRLVQGDLGKSMRTREPVMEALRRRVPVTIEVSLLAMAICMVVGIPTAIVAAVRQYSLADYASTVAALVGVSIPDFWLGTLLILVFTVAFRALPAGGVLPSIFQDPVGNLQRMIMPALALGLPSASVFFRMTRSALLEVIHSDYIRTARAKGLKERRVVLIHGLKNALIPVVTVGGLEFVWMLGGSFIIETMFSLPGLGQGTITAIYNRDFTLVQGSLLVYGAMVVSLSLLVDMLYGFLDPRIRYDLNGNAS